LAFNHEKRNKLKRRIIWVKSGRDEEE